MRKPRRTEEERKKLLAWVDLDIARRARRRRLYNRKYRRSPFFISAWVTRLLYFVIFFIACFTHYDTYSYSDEFVLTVSTETYTSASRYTTKSVTELDFRTDLRNYHVKYSGISPPELKRGDNLIIDKNFFGKPIFYAKPDWMRKYAFNDHFKYYFMILFATLISLFFNDGLDRFTGKILKIICGLNILAIAFYLLE